MEVKKEVFNFSLNMVNKEYIFMMEGEKVQPLWNSKSTILELQNAKFDCVRSMNINKINEQLDKLKMKLSYHTCLAM